MSGRNIINTVPALRARHQATRQRYVIVLAEPETPEASQKRSGSDALQPIRWAARSGSARSRRDTP